jgi:hypothetical protein
MTCEPTFRFRGQRRYLHSTSLFDDLLQRRGAAAMPVDMKFHQRTARQVRYMEALPSSNEPVAEWSDAAGKLYVLPREETITEIEPYDESALISMLALEGKTVSVPATTPGFSRIEAIIAGFKHLMQQARPTDKKYVFVRIRLDRMPQGTFKIRYARDLGAFFQGDILVDGEALGHIFFGEWA